MRAWRQDQHTRVMNANKTDLQRFSDSFSELVSRTAGGVVAVKAGAYRTASGLSLREDVIATTDQTLRREERVPVHALDGTQGTGTLLGRVPQVNAAFLRVDGLRLSPLAVSDPTLLRPGMLAGVVGLTTDAGPSTSLGILGAVSGPRRTWRWGMIDHFIRLDANVYPSQAGAAVVDCAGGLIGMATPGLLQYSAVAVPIVTLNRVLDELLKQGRIRQGYLGVGLQRVAIPVSFREKIPTTQESGLIILSVEANSAAEKAGLQLGDILVSLDGKPLNDVDDLQNALTGENVGREVEVVIVRGGAAFTRQIAIFEREKKGR